MVALPSTVARAVRRLVFAASLVVASGAAHGQSVPIRPSQPGAWLVFLCQASDDASTPKNAAYFDALFDRTRTDLLVPYFKEVSFGKVDVGGTYVLGWFRMDVTTAQIAPGVRNNSTSPNRSQTIADCRKAGMASLASQNIAIAPEQFAGFIAVINVLVDSGHAGGNTVVANQYEPASFYEHEMMHAMGLLIHTWDLPNNAGTDHVWGVGTGNEYDDPWDIMSYGRGFSTPTSDHGSTGPELNIAYRSLLGWTSPGRTLGLSVRGDADRTVTRTTLAPVSNPQVPGPLMAVVTLPGGVRYTVEYHQATGFDRGDLRNEVVVREWRSDQVTHVIRQSNGHVGFYPGEPPFTDIGNHLKITANAVGDNGADVVIDTNSPPIAESAALQIGPLPLDPHLSDHMHIPVHVTNSGATTWTPSHVLVVRRQGSLDVVPNFARPGSLAPGQSTTIMLEVVCVNTGPGGLTLAIDRPDGTDLLTSASATAYCKR